MKTSKFNLERVLAGDPIVTLGGVKVTDFKERPESKRFRRYKYQACIEGDKTNRYFDAEGFCISSGKHYNLRMVKQEPTIFPFDLKRALNGDALITRGGREVEILCGESILSDVYPIMAKVGNTGSIYSVLSYTRSGKLRKSSESSLDLFMKHPASTSSKDLKEPVKEEVKEDTPKDTTKKGCDCGVDTPVELRKPSENKTKQGSLGDLLAIFETEARNSYDKAALEALDKELLLINVYGVEHKRVRLYQQSNSELLEHGYNLRDN